MRFGPPLHPDQVADRRRLIQSVAGAALIASVGFALIFLLFGYFPSLVLAWAECHPQAVGALLALSRKSPLWLFIIQFSVALPGLGALIGMLISRRLRYNSVTEVNPI